MPRTPRGAGRPIPADWGGLDGGESRTELGPVSEWEPDDAGPGRSRAVPRVPVVPVTTACPVEGLGVMPLTTG